MLHRACAFVLIPFALLLETADVEASAQRTFVASKGNDANPCTLVLPCRGFSAAVAQTAAGGEVVILDSAGYGTVTVTKSVSLIAPPGIYAGISVNSGDGITINGAGVSVVLRGLTINGLGASSTDGIEFIQGAELTVEECEIAGMGANFGAEITIAGSVLARNAIGVHVLASSSSWSKLTLVRSVLIGVPTAPSFSLGVFLDTTSGSIASVVLDGNDVFEFAYAVWFSKGGVETVFSRQNNTIRTAAQ
jgi:hypothetical protein